MGLIVSFDDVQQMGTDSGGDIIYYYEEKPFTGNIQEFSNGILIGESEFTNGHRGGIQRDYYPCGQIKEEFTIQFNKMEGTFTEWDENGNVISKTNWQNGVQIS